MSKYNKGDKFVIEIDEVFRNDADDIIHEEELYRIRGFKSLVFDDYGLDKLHQAITPAEDGLVDMAKVTEAYNKGLEDAWELAKKIVVDCKDMTGKEFQDIFGYYLHEVFVNYTPQEALAKLEAYEKEQAEIKVGDVVQVKNGYEFLVTHISKEKTHYFGITTTGDTYTSVHISELTNTGKHIDIQSVLQQIGGAE